MKDLNKVLWFVYDFHEPGGGERWVLEGERVFKKNSVKTQIVCKNFNKNVFFNGKYDVPVKILTDKSINTKSSFSKLIGFFLLIIKLRRLIKVDKSQIILCQGFREIVIVYFATIFTSVKYSIIDFGQIYHFKGIKIKYSHFYKNNLLKINSILESLGEKPDLNNPPKSFINIILNEVKGFLIYLANKKSSNIFTLSERVKDEVKELYNKDACVIKCAYNDSIFEKRLEFSDKNIENKSIILTVSRLVPNKRVDLCLRAIDFLRRTNENFIFYIGGTGPEMKNLKKLAKKLDIEAYVKFLGFINESELKDYYLSCEMFTTMDHCDFDITPYMALALGKKVVWANIMEIDSNLSNNKHIFRVDPLPEKIAMKYDKVLKTYIGSNSKEEEASLYQYTYENAFKKLLDQIILK